MVRKEDLCDWFKALPAHKRVDYLCGLLHMCLPLELRFTGTVLEDLAKKDFHYLRDQEIKANQRTDLSSNNSNSLSDPKLRAKILTALALMNSTNSPCAEVIFDILQQQFDTLLGLLHNKVCADDLILILTMAVHHPAFAFYQKETLSQVLNRVSAHLQEISGDDDDDERDLILQSQTLTPSLIQPSSLNSSQSPISQPGKASVVAIEVISAEPSQKKGGADYRIRTIWSNETVSEVSLKFKQLQELHYKMLHRFPEQKKTHTSLPVFPGKVTHNGETLSDQINSLNGYFSKLAKAPAHILDCDILAETLRNGTVVYQPKSASSMHATSSAKAPMPSHPQAMYIHTSPLREDRKFEFPPYREPFMEPFSMVAHSHMSPGTSQLSSAANSPANSRTSSPAPVAPHTGGIQGSNPPPVSTKGNNVPVSGLGILQPMRSPDPHISQQLHLLHPEEYDENLKDFSFQQVVHMGKEELAKAGLPVEAQAKLKSKLDQCNGRTLTAEQPDFNGLVDVSRCLPAETSPVFYPPYGYPQYAFISAYPSHFYHPSPYATQSGHIALMPSQHPHIPANENSPANSEISSPPPSPLQPAAGLLIDQTQVQPGPLLHVMSSPTTLVDGQEGKLGKNVKPQQMDNSGSEEERTAGFGQEHGTLKNKGRGRPQESKSLPMISLGNLSIPAIETAKVAGLPISMSAPHSHPGVISAEPRTDNTSPLQAVTAQHVSANTAAISMGINGYISDPPPLTMHGASSVLPRPIRSFKTPQPAHTSLAVHKNILNMPAPDITKSGSGTIVHGNLPPQSYTIGPSIASVPPTHMIGLPVNYPANNSLPLGPHPSPAQPHMPEGNNPFSMIMYSHHRGILTTIANSTTIMTTTQSQHSGPPMSHSPSPAGTVISPEQLPAAPFIAEALDVGRSEGSSRTPPMQATAHISAIKSQTNSGGTPNSATPSPPLVPTAPKQVGPNDPQPGVRGPQVINYINGYVPHHFIYSQTHQAPQHFPNGIVPDYTSLMRLPHSMASSHLPFAAYGSVYPSQNVSVPLFTTPGSSTQPPSTNQSHASAGGSSGKSLCCNCGQAGHKVSECNESRMENMTNTFHLSYKPDPPA